MIWAEVFENFRPDHKLSADDVNGGGPYWAKAMPPSDDVDTNGPIAKKQKVQQKPDKEMTTEDKGEKSNPYKEMTTEDKGEKSTPDNNAKKLDVESRSHMSVESRMKALELGLDGAEKSHLQSVERVKLLETSFHQHQKTLDMLKSRKQQIELRVSSNPESGGGGSGVDAKPIKIENNCVEPTERKCYKCENMCKSTHLTRVSCYEKLLKDPNVNKETLDMVHLMAPPASKDKKIAVRVAKNSPLLALQLCEECLPNKKKGGDSDVVSLLQSIKNNDWICQWCRTKFPRTTHGHTSRLCDACSSGVGDSFIESGFCMLQHLLGATALQIGVDDDVVKLSIGDEMQVVVDSGCNRDGEKPDYEKDQKHIGDLTLLNKDPKFRVYIKIDLLDDGSPFDPLARWMAARDLVVMLYRMFEKNEFIGDDPLFYMFYKKDSCLIDSARKPYIVSTAVSLPSSLLSNINPRRFVDWECMMDPLLSHLLGTEKEKISARHLMFHLRVPLDSLPRA